MFTLLSSIFHWYIDYILFQWYNQASLYDERYYLMKTELDIKRLKTCREKLGITKQEAAKRIGVSQPAYLRYEAGTRTPTMPVINAIAKMLDVSADYLTGKTNRKNVSVITVEKSAQPKLFEIVEACRKMDDKQIKRLQAYLEKLSQKRESLA